jgi:diguanylate cyclase (GGDEF)-like protein/PAS domain S-box-containing protein
MTDSPETAGSAKRQSSGEGQKAAVDERRVRAQQQALLHFASEFLVFVTEDGEIVVGAGEGLSVLGYESTERSGYHIAEHIHPDDLPEVLDLVERARRTPDFHETIHARARHKDGQWLTFEATVIGISDHGVLGTGAVLRVREVEKAGTDPTTPSDANRFLSLAEALPLGILSADARGWVVYCNHTAQQTMNLPDDKIRGRGWLEVVHAEDLPDVMEAAGMVVRTGTPQQATFRIQTGLFVRWATARFVPLGAENRRTGWIATLDDITDRRRAESQLAHRATHDPLTELPNRTLLEDRLDQACARLRRNPDSGLSVLFVDLDDFKDINDTFGHTTGDEVLKEVGRRLRAVLRPADTVARLGGDEFVAVCEGIGEFEVSQVADRIASAIAVPMLVTGKQLTIAASIGIAYTVDSLQDAAELLVRADQAMYRRKRARREAKAPVQRSETG